MKVLTYHKDSPITQYLIQKDPLLKDLFAKKDVIYVRVSDDYFVSLVDTIIAQQLSSKVDQVISPQKIMDATEESLRPLGLSFQKIKYLKSLADCIIQGKVDLSNLESKSDQEIIDMFIQVKGIGVWTAQMFLMFSLGREDVFSVLDLGLRNAVKRIYQNQELSHQEIEQLAENWAPYRSVVSHFLWHAWDSE